MPLCLSIGPFQLPSLKVTRRWRGKASSNRASRSSTSKMSSVLTTASYSDAESAFIAEHGRLRRHISTKSFDPFRRHSPRRPVALTYVCQVLALILIPLRIIFILLTTPIPYILVLLFGPTVNAQVLHAYSVERLPPWRRSICEFATRFLGRSLLFALGFWRINGRDHPQFRISEAARATIVSNHISLGDPCLLAYLYAPAFVAKMAVALIPMVGRVGAAQHSFYIDRLDDGARSTTKHIIDRQRLVAEPSTGIPPVCIFPEGTTTNGHYLLRFRTGAFVAGTPVAPILLRYQYRYFSPSYEAIKTKEYVLGLLSQIWNSVEYCRLPVYFPSEEEKKNPRLYADNVRQFMHDHSDFLEGTHTFELSDSNFIDKMEYLSLLRGTPLKKGVKLT